MQSAKKKIIWKKYGLATRTRWIANFLAEPKKARDSKIIYLNDIEQRLKMGMWDSHVNVRGKWQGLGGEHSGPRQ